ncbi:asparagine synthase (glutamine-hydrolyzing) [Fidelibacter multiformis]|uniref:asparagine synthase (glutamine-hydrolyzing) n=1 Tax=Fidelibacter multiformis TaxID=3377529 RepID=UPI0037DD63BD
MCGILGTVEAGGTSPKRFQQMLDLIRHRGPDAESTYRHGNVTLGHRRLAIIDLKTGDQPIFNEDHSIAVIYNGEIYNYKEIREELKALGHHFCTESDTEILVHGYESWGTDFFHRLNGIFAFAILDQRQDSLILVRDHFGIKPLHYTHQNGLFAFASEQKPLLLHPSTPRELNLQSLHTHLNLRYTQNDQTLFQGIYRLPPAHYLVYRNKQINIHKYWELTPEIRDDMTENEAVAHLHEYLRQAVKRQLISDVPLGVYLSGGMDSSVIVQKMSELGVPDIKTFTLGFNEPTDEFPDAERVARHFNTDHHTLSLSMEPLKMFPEVLWHAEEPKINLLQGFNMSAFVKPHVSVVLGGLGGDELLAGYDIHRFIYPLNRLHNRIPGWMKKIGDIKSRILFRMEQNTGVLRLDEYRRGLQMLLALGQIEKYYLILRNVWDYDNPMYDQIYHRGMAQQMRAESLKVHKAFDPFFQKVNHMSALDQVLFTEFHTKMVNDYLLVEDRMSMSHSVEERVPFLDLDLVQFGFSVPAGLKMKGNRTKDLFRKAMEPYLPEKITQKKKWGFTVNPYLQFKKDLKDVCEKVLTRDIVEKQGLFNYEYIRKILDAPPHPRLRWHYNFLWVIMGLAVWQKMFIESDAFAERHFDLESYMN